MGIAIGAGTDVAMETADVVLMKSDPFDVIGAIALSRATLRKMHQNLWWAVGYNTIAFPIAAGLFYRFRPRAAPGDRRAVHVGIVDPRRVERGAAAPGAPAAPAPTGVINPHPNPSPLPFPRAERGDRHNVARHSPHPRPLSRKR